MRFKDMLDLSYLNLNSQELIIEKEFGLLKSEINNADEFFEKLKS